MYNCVNQCNMLKIKAYLASIFRTFLKKPCKSTTLGSDYQIVDGVSGFYPFRRCAVRSRSRAKGVSFQFSKQHKPHRHIKDV